MTRPNAVFLDVAELQRALIAAGFDIGAGGADGLYGPATDEAFRAYMRGGRPTAIAELRDRFAIAALQGLLATDAPMLLAVSKTRDEIIEAVSRQAYDFAGAMLKARAT
jgi:hypothetical protein